VVAGRQEAADQQCARGAAADHGGCDPKRIARDPEYRTRLEIADHHHLPTSELSDWDRGDLDDAIGLRAFKAECCGTCGFHPSVTDRRLGGHPDALRAVWRHCRICEVLERARKAGPPDKEDPGWHLVLESNPNLTRR
jgi:hypothetical protein